MILKIAGFDWDKGNKIKCQKHGLSQDEIEQFFAGEIYTQRDAKHSADEVRHIAIGKTVEGRGIFAAFTLRKIDKGLFVRPITARYMHKRELEVYEEKIATIQNR